jgi:hypothetical protein
MATIPLCQVLEEEYTALHGELPPDYPRDGSNDRRLAEIYRLIHALPHKRAALCLSGGGIRSATFGLGVLQGLAAHGLLGTFHYLSTVSGGGYVGSWLTAWIHRHPRGIQGVTEDLRDPSRSKIDPEPAPIRHLRAYSNYMTPQLGLLSADTWTLVATYLRNLLLNWLVLVPLLAAVLAIPRLGVPVARATPNTSLSVDGWLEFGVLGCGFFLAAAAIAYISMNLPSLNACQRDRHSFFRSHRDQNGFLWWCLLPLMGASIAFVTYWAWYCNADGQPHGWLSFVLFGALLHSLGWTPYLLQEYRAHKLWQLSAILATGGLGGLLVWWVATSIPILLHPGQFARSYVCLAAPLLLTLLLLAMTLFVGVASRWTDDEDREWWARAGAWVVVASAGWGVISALVLFGPEWLSAWFARFPGTVTSLGGVSGLITILFGRSAKTAANPKQEEKMDWPATARSLALSCAAPLFGALLIVLLALATNTVIAGLSAGLSSGGDPYGPAADFLLVGGVALVMLAIGLGMGLVINVNKFSLHAMYRNRLIRAYLGASRETRAPHPFTGFDPDDNMSMAQLKQKPLHVVNIALNLVSGSNLAWQQRKAESFTVTPLHAGSYRLGYRRAADYGKNDKGESVSLGTAVAISGAAASPNMGYHSSPAITFLLTLFNARLGWWLGNPGDAGAETFDRAYPKFAVRPFLAETFGLTNDQNQYVYLSDGGHFENLGLYEMVLRRCQIIVVSDAGCDAGCAFEDLGNAIRKIRVDLGVPIEIREMPIYARQSGKLGKCCAVGTIHYSFVDGDGAADGLLLYFKPTFYGDEPVDIFNYAAANAAFPHETTADQWFSESQFESYRMLGFSAIRAVCGTDWQGKGLDDLLGRAREYLKPGVLVDLASAGPPKNEAPGARNI